MAEKDSAQNPSDDANKQGGGAAIAEPKKAQDPSKQAKPKPKPPGVLPQWKVLLHNDDVNDMRFVVLTLIALTPLKEKEAVIRTVEAHQSGVALILITHKERAELYQEQFESKGLTVTIEPAT